MSVNAVLNAIRSGMSVVFPLITYPYALHVLGAEGIGRVSFGNSIISYFSLFAAMGVSTYAVREGVKRKNNREAFSMFCSEILAINLISMFFSYLLLGVYLGISETLQSYRLLIAIQSISIFLTTIGMDWINVIYENYSMMTVRSIVTYIVSAFFLYLLVRHPEDYYRYAFLIVLSNGIVCVSNLYYVRRHIVFSFRRKSEILPHLKPMITFFANNAAIAVYVNIDMTMVGFMKGDVSTGIYAAAVRVYTVIKDIFIALYVVALPKLVQCIEKKEDNEYRKIYTDVVCGIMLLLIPVGNGLFMMADEIMYVLGGNEFIAAGGTLRILSFSLVAAVLGGLITALHNVATKREKTNLSATVYGAILNAGLNVYFINRFNYNGAAFTTLIAEVFVVLYCLGKEKDYMNFIDVRRLRGELCNAVGASLLFVGYILCLKAFQFREHQTLVLAVLGSAIIYSIYLWIVKDHYVMIFLKRYIMKEQKE